MKIHLSLIFFCSILCIFPALQADEIRFKDGIEIVDCLVRDEGRLMRVWLSREDFPDQNRIYPRDDVERFRIKRGPEWDACRCRDREPRLIRPRTCGHGDRQERDDAGEGLGRRRLNVWAHQGADRRKRESSQRGEAGRGCRDPRIQWRVRQSLQ